MVHVHVLLLPRHLRARFAQRAGGRGGELRIEAARFPQDRAAIAGLSRDQSQGPRAHTENPARRFDGDAGDPRLCRAEFSRGQPRAVGRPFRLRAIAGVHHLSLLDRACRSRPWATGLSVGGRGGFVRRHETQGSRERRRLFRIDRDPDVQRAVGDGGRLFDRRSLPLHARDVAGGGRRRSRTFPACGRTSSANGGPGERQEGDRTGNGGVMAEFRQKRAFNSYGNTVHSGMNEYSRHQTSRPSPIHRERRSTRIASGSSEPGAQHPDRARRGGGYAGRAGSSRLADSLSQRGPRGNLERLRFGKLEDHIRSRRGRHHELGFGGLSLMTEALTAIRMRPTHPGVFIREEVLGELGISVSEAAEALGVRRATLSDVVNGKAAVSPEMALRIEKAFGVNMDTLLKMQAWFDACEMRDRADQIVVKRYVPESRTRG